DQVPSNHDSWQLRIDLPDYQYVNVYARHHITHNPGFLPGFAHVVDRVLTAKCKTAAAAQVSPIPVDVAAEVSTAASN
ncbi:MAG: hypothetical protein JO099_00250, partial [Acidobacteriia bacterium]|nr:hypothetical protein [Terriglobia bacterium]